MRKRRVVLFLLVTFSVLALVTACGSGGGGGGGGGNTGFVGSCTGSPGEDICVDYYDGYTTADAKDLCNLTGDIYSSDPCSTVNASETKIPGKCEVIDPPSFDNRLSQISYYETLWNLSAAQAHCSAFPADYTATWISD